MRNRICRVIVTASCTALFQFGTAMAQTAPQTIVRDSHDTITVTATQNGTAIGKVEGPVTIYQTCGVKVSIAGAKVVTGPGCDPNLAKDVQTVLDRIIKLEGKSNRELTQQEYEQLIAVSRSTFKSVRVAKLEVDAARLRYEDAKSLMTRYRALFVTGQLSQAKLDYALSDLRAYQFVLVERLAAYRYAVTGNLVEELKVFEAQVQQGKLSVDNEMHETLARRKKFDDGEIEFGVWIESSHKLAYAKADFAIQCALYADKVSYTTDLAKKANPPEDISDKIKSPSLLGCPSDPIDENTQQSPTRPPIQSAPQSNLETGGEK